ncbi:MAG: helix-turn-helix transcriptional regulator [Bacteroidales bacterium]
MMPRQFILRCVALAPILAINVWLNAQVNTFDSLYNAGIENIRIDLDKSRDCLGKLRRLKNFSPVQRAKLNCLKVKICRQGNGFTIDTVQLFDIQAADSLYSKGVEYINHGDATHGLPILYGYISKNKNTIPDTLLNYLNIVIAEGLRINVEYSKAVDILRGVLNQPKLSLYGRAYAYNRLAAIYDFLPTLSFSQRVDSVIKYSKLAIGISQDRGFIYLLALSQNELGSIYRISNINLNLAEYYCNQAFNNFIKAGLYRNAINTSLVLSDIYIRQKNYRGALEQCGKVTDSIDIVDNEDLFMRTYLQQAKVSSLLGNYSDAYEYLSVGRLLEKQIFESIMSVQINELSAKYNLAVKEAKIAEVQHVVAFQRNNIKYLLIILSITLLTFLLSVLFFILRRKNLKQKHDLERAEKEKLQMLFEWRNRELTQALASNIAKNDILKTLKREVIQGTDPVKLIKTINSNIDISQSWKKTLLEFQNLYPEFVPSLTLKHPDITSTEIKLCTLLVLKLSTKEIADILSVSEAAVSKNRQRLRKHLNLDREADLYEYLKNMQQ